MCDICFDDDTAHGPMVVCLNNTRFNVAAKACTLVMCPPCLDEYLGVCHSSRALPRCPSCRALLQCTKSVRHACHQWLVEHGHDSLWQTGADYRAIVEKVVATRNHYLVENFPRAVSRLALVMFPDKLKRIGREQKQRLMRVVERSSASSCIMSGCFGTMLVDDKTGRPRCLTCSNEQCPRCREVWANAEHQCNEDILKSVEQVQKIRACPSCGVAIEKSEGCNSMTCAQCGCRFLYSSGLVGGHGSHNRNVLDLHHILSSDLSAHQVPRLQEWQLLMQEAHRLCRQAPPATADRVAFLYQLSGRQLFLNQSTPVVERVRHLLLNKDEDDELDDLVATALDAFDRIDRAYYVPSRKNKVARHRHNDDHDPATADAPAHQG